MQQYEQQLDQLRKGKVQSIEVTKAEFLAFREALVQAPDFKHFRGEAKQGGNIIFTFLEVPRA